MGAGHAVTGQNDRMLRLTDDVSRAGDGTVRRADMHSIRQRQWPDSGWNGHLGHVFGQNQTGCTGAFPLCYGEGLTDDFRHRTWCGDHTGPLRQWAEHRHQIHDLM